MKDRQPTRVLANGAIRYGIYSADGTLVRYEYMKREDAPTVEGTPLNKANLLSDETEAKIWRGNNKPEEPTVNDALNKLADGTAKIGDIETTARTGMSSAWLRCNGSSITQSQYPELYSVLRTSASPQPFAIKSDTARFGHMWFVNGEWLGTRRAYDSSSRVYLDTVYTSSDLINWTQRGTIQFELNGDYIITYHDGVYYLVNVYLNSSPRTVRLYSVDQLDGSWESVASYSGLTSDLNDYAVHVYFSKNVMYIFAEGSGATSSGYFTGVFTIPLFWRVGSSTINLASSGSIAGTVMYDEVTDSFYYVSSAEQGATSHFYKSASLPYLEWELVKDIPLNTLAPTEAPGSYKYFYNWYARMSGTMILAFFECKYTSTASEDSGCITYVYSLDRGATWKAGNIVSRTTAFKPDVHSVFNDGLFAGIIGVLLGSNTYATKVLAISDPAATPVLLDYDSNGGTPLEVVQGSQIVYSSDSGIMVCDFSDKAKALPTITPGAGSYAYIKALEE